MVKCTACEGAIVSSQLLKCTSENCINNYHYECVGMPRSVYSKTLKSKSTWKCPDKCAKLRVKPADNSDTPVRHIGELSTPASSPMKDPELGAGASTPLPENADIKDLLVVITRLTNEISALKGKFEDVAHSLCHCHDRIDELELRVSAHDDCLKNLEKRDQEVVSLKVTVSILQGELHAQTQKSLLNELEIVGVPETNNENLGHIVKVAAQKVGVQLADEEIDWVTRVGARRPPVPAGSAEFGGRLPRPVVVRLMRRSKRDQLIRASKSRKNLTSTDLDIPGAPAKLFFNERLTKENRILFRETRVRARNNGYAFCWCNQGSIYIRQREGKAAQLVRSLHDLDRLVPPLVTGTAGATTAAVIES